MTDARDRETKRNFGTLLALVGLVLCGVCLILLMAIVMPQAAGILAVVFAMGLIIVIHYVTWGWWMLKLRPGDSEEDEKTNPHIPSDDSPRSH